MRYGLKNEKWFLFPLAILVAVLFVGMTLYSVNALAPVTEEAVAIYEKRVEHYSEEYPDAQAELEKREAALEAEEARVKALIPEGATEEEIRIIEEADEKLIAAKENVREATVRERTAKNQLAKYETRTREYPQKDQYYILSMGLILLFYLVGMAYIKMSKTAAFAAPFSAIALLLGIGRTYQFLFSISSGDVLMLLLFLIFGIGTYFVWRRLNSENGLVFWTLAVLIIGLLGANLLFGQDHNTGAKLWISFFGKDVQPGEFVKVFLILLGGLAHRKRWHLAYSIIALTSCGVMLYLRDLGSAFVIFFVFVLMTYLLWDSLKVSLGWIGGATVAFLVALSRFDYARKRFMAVFGAMDGAQDSQQADTLRTIILGGGQGLGLEKSLSLYDIFSAESDAALAGILATFGIFLFLAVMISYAMITVLPRKNYAVTPTTYYITCQVSLMITLQVLLNFLGSVDAFPFTGIVAPLISAGGSSLVAFGILLGAMFASLNPKLKLKEVPKE